MKPDPGLLSPGAWLESCQNRPLPQTPGVVPTALGRSVSLLQLHIATNIYQVEEKGKKNVSCLSLSALLSLPPTHYFKQSRLCTDMRTYEKTLY